VGAAEELLTLGFDTPDAARRGAQALLGAGQAPEALEAFRVYRELLVRDEPGAVVPDVVRLSEARAELAAGRPSRTLSVATELSVSDERTVALAAFSLRRQALRSLGRSGEVRNVEDQLMARFPNSGETVEILFGRAETQRTRGNREAAIQGYQAAVDALSAHNLAGQARMRIAQLLESMGRPQEAVDVYRDYMAEFPDGRRWDEAAFWAAYLLRGMEKEEEAGLLFSELLSHRPLSYYAVRASQLTGEAFVPVSVEAPDTLPMPSAIRSGLARIDELVDVGLVAEAEWEIDALSRQIKADPDPERRRKVVLRLAHELNDRGFTREGINLGWDVRREGVPMDRHLLSAIYPFPYQNILEAEAASQRADPYLLAGLIRQESAFWAEARSRADARGLMQVLPATGRELARSRGPRGFRADDHLYEPEINIHLGTAFFADMRRRFGEDLPIILSAYNAGPSRATRWRQFPEAADMIRFVERIPFTETRGYVKNVTLNRAIYTWLYGPGSAAIVGP
jgi:soluble lytic murein transglycosylase